MIDQLILLCVAAISLPFVAYPLLLALRAHVSPVAIEAANIEPDIDLVIAAHDEAASIGQRIENALALDYPSDKLHVWIASDGSRDATVEIARHFESRGVRVLDLPRGGKAAALAAAVEASSSAIIALSDANSDWQKDALRALVRPFADLQVGGVAGDQRYAGKSDEAVGERGYWSFDRQLKRWQSRAGNAISATGAIYAIRRELFEPPPADATDDFMISTGVIARGQRLVFAESAIALEPPAEATGGEFRRKVRIITRGLRGVFYRRALLNPARTGLYALELAIHKLLRRLVWIPLVLLVSIAPFAWAAEAQLAWVAVAALAGVALGVTGLLWPSLTRARIVAVAAYVVMVNAACARATLNALLGRRVARWETQRPGNAAVGPTR